MPASTGLSLPFLVFALFAGHAFAAMALMVLPSVAPKAAVDYGVDPSLIGYQIAIVSVGLIVSLLFLGNLNRRAGGARTNQYGHALVAIGMLLMLLPSFAFLVAGSFAVGMGYGLLAPSATYLLMRFTPPERRSLVFSLQQTGVPLGGMLAASLAPAIAIAAGWRWSLVLSAVLLTAVVALMQRGRRRWDDDRDRTARVVSVNPLAGVVLVWRHARLRAIAISAGCFCWGQFVVIAYTVVTCVEALGMTLVEAGLVATVAQFFSAAGRVGAGWLADRVGSARRVLSWIAWIMLAACIVTLWIAPGWPVLLVFALFAVHGVTTGAWAGVLLAELGRLAPKGEVSLTITGSLVYLNLGKCAGPVVFALVYAATRDYGIAFASVGAPAVLALWCLRRVKT